MIRSPEKRKWGSSRCVWAAVGSEPQRRTQGELEDGSFEWEGRGWEVAAHMEGMAGKFPRRSRRAGWLMQHGSPGPESWFAACLCEGAPLQGGKGALGWAQAPALGAH